MTEYFKKVDVDFSKDLPKKAGTYLSWTTCGFLYHQSFDPEIEHDRKRMVTQIKYYYLPMTIDEIREEINKPEIESRPLPI